MTEQKSIEEAPGYVASYLWNERLFGMKTKRLGPPSWRVRSSFLSSRLLILSQELRKSVLISGRKCSIDSYIMDAEKGVDYGDIPDRFQKKEIFY